MSEDARVRVALEVLPGPGPKKPDVPHVPWGKTPEIQAAALQVRRLYYDQCQRADEAFAMQHPGLLFERLCDRPENRRFLEDLSGLMEEPGRARE